MWFFCGRHGCPAAGALRYSRGNAAALLQMCAPHGGRFWVNVMTFSSQVKKELCAHIIEKTCCARAFCFGAACFYLVCNEKSRATGSIKFIFVVSFNYFNIVLDISCMLWTCCKAKATCYAFFFVYFCLVIYKPYSFNRAISNAFVAVFTVFSCKIKKPQIT